MGAGVSGGSGGPAADMYDRLVRAVLGRDKEASARPGAQETVERLLRVLQAQTQNLKVKPPPPPFLCGTVFATCACALLFWFAVYREYDALEH